MVILDEINQRILRTIGLYRVGTRSTIASLLPQNGEPDKRLAKLVKQGFLRTHKPLPGNRSAFQLTKKGAAEVGVSPARGRIAGTQSLLKNLGVLLFCHVPETQRHRVEAEELSRALSTTLLDGAYCLCQIKDKTVVFECYVPGPQTPISAVVRHLNKMFKAARRDPALGQAIRDLRYGLAVIVPSNERRKAIMDAVRTKGEHEAAPLIKRVRVWVEAVDELAALCGTAAPSLGRAGRGAGPTLLFSDLQELTGESRAEP